MKAVEHSKNKSERTIWGFLLSWSDDSEEYQTMSELKEHPPTLKLRSPERYWHC